MPNMAIACCCGCPLCASTPRTILVDEAGILPLPQFVANGAPSNGNDAEFTLSGSSGTFTVTYAGTIVEDQNLFCVWTFDGETEFEVLVQEYFEGNPVGSQTAISCDSIHVEVRRSADGTWQVEGDITFTYDGITYTYKVFGCLLTSDPTDCIGTFGPTDNDGPQDGMGYSGSTTLTA